MNRPLPSTIGYSACPHDCPSTCALEVEVIDGVTVGRVHGAKANDYTAGVICAKVARYAERIHNPNRVLHPLRRKGEKGRRRLAADRLGRCARPCRRGLHQSRSPTWVGGGLAVLLRRHDGAGAAGRYPSSPARRSLLGSVRHHLHDTSLCGICSRRRQACRARPARDGEVGPRRDLGDQRGRHPGQRHDPRGQGAEGAGRADRGHRRLPQRNDAAGRHRTLPQARHRRGACLRRDACPVPRRICGPRLSREVHRCAARARSTPPVTDAGMGVGHNRVVAGGDRSISRRPSARPSALSSASATVSPAPGTAPCRCTQPHASPR